MKSLKARIRWRRRDPQPTAVGLFAIALRVIYLPRLDPDGVSRLLGSPARQTLGAGGGFDFTPPFRLAEIQRGHLNWDQRLAAGALGMVIRANTLMDRDVLAAFSSLGSPALSWNTSRGPVDGSALVYQLDPGHLRIVFPDQEHSGVQALLVDRFPAESGLSLQPAEAVSRLAQCPFCGADWHDRSKIPASWIEDVERDAVVAYQCRACGSWWRRFTSDSIERVASGAHLPIDRCRA